MKTFLKREIRPQTTFISATKNIGIWFNRFTKNHLFFKHLFLQRTSNEQKIYSKDINK